MEVTLLNRPNEIEAIIATAARTCYSPKKIKDIINTVHEKQEENNTFVKHLREMGHESPLEHVSFTFGIDGVSRALTHQLVRHRIASFSQQSQRYVNGENFGFVIPPDIEKDENLKKMFNSYMLHTKRYYKYLVDKGIKKEDARYLLPNSTTTNIVVTMNVRELIHFFSLRCCTRAQWEIRELAWKMLKICKEVAPSIFNGCGAFCDQNHYCKEGSMSCGRYPVLANLLNPEEDTRHV